MAHIPQILQALRIDGIKTEYYSWRGVDEESKQKAQIDLIIERADRMINLCELKYCNDPYTLDKEEYEKYLNRMALFRQHTSYSGGIVPTFVTTFGMKRNSYAEHITSQITMDDLFEM